MAQGKTDKIITLRDGDKVVLETDTAQRTQPGGRIGNGPVYRLRLIRAKEDGTVENRLLSETVEERVGDKIRTREVPMTIDADSRLVVEGTAKNITLVMPPNAGRDPADAKPRLVMNNPHHVALQGGSCIIDADSKFQMRVFAAPNAGPTLKKLGEGFVLSIDNGAAGKREIEIEQKSAGVLVDTSSGGSTLRNYIVSGRKNFNANMAAGRKYGLRTGGEPREAVQQKDEPAAMPDRPKFNAKDLRALNNFKQLNFAPLEKTLRRGIFARDRATRDGIEEIMKPVREALDSKDIETAREAMDAAADKAEAFGKDGGVKAMFSEKFKELRQEFDGQMPPRPGGRDMGMSQLPYHALAAAREAASPIAGLKGRQSDPGDFDKARERTGGPALPGNNRSLT